MEPQPGPLILCDGRLCKVMEDLRWEYDPVDWRRPEHSGALDLVLEPLAADRPRIDLGVLVRMLNGYLERMSAAIAEHRGTVSKCIGDGILALFGALAPTPLAGRRRGARRARDAGGARGLQRRAGGRGTAAPRHRHRDRARRRT
jgi:hypothetical protein